MENVKLWLELEILPESLAAAHEAESIQRSTSFARDQQAVVEAFPRSRAALAFRKMADKADRWPRPHLASGQVEFFVERLIHAGQDMLGCTA